MTIQIHVNISAETAEEAISELRTIASKIGSVTTVNVPVYTAVPELAEALNALSAEKPAETTPPAADEKKTDKPAKKTKPAAAAPAAEEPTTQADPDPAPPAAAAEEDEPKIKREDLRAKLKALTEKGVDIKPLFAAIGVNKLAETTEDLFPALLEEIIKAEGK